MKSWETIAKCTSCGLERVKRKSEYNPETYMCAKCFRKNRGKELGNKFGKAQKKQGACKGCGTTISTSIKWCDSCQDKKKKSFIDTMTGENNPVWTGKSICSCGNKKTNDAKECRDCSFKNGKRSGKNNGRYVKKDRERYLKNLKAAKVIRGVFNNVCKTAGIVKAKRKTKDMLGYSWEEFTDHMEQLFEDGMTWDNHGEWHVDHITPVDFFVKNNVVKADLINALDNLRPVWAIDNIKKSNKYNKTKVLLIAGVSGCGKTTMVNELNSELVIDGDYVKPDDLIYATLNKSIVAYTLTIGISSFIKRFSNIYDIELYVVNITKDQLERNLNNRGSQLSDKIIKRANYMKKLALKASGYYTIEEIKNKLRMRVVKE